MVRVEQKELLLLAKSARLRIADQQQEDMSQKLESVLNYVALLEQRLSPHALGHMQLNVLTACFRPDVSGVCPANELLALAPHQEDRYFIVPAVL